MDLHTSSRRDFLRAATATTALGAAGLPQWALARHQDAPAHRFAADAIVPLGKTGLHVSRLAQGTGFNGYNQSSEQTRAGKDSFERLMKHALERGVTFIDMADLYGSHPFVREVIKSLPREKLVLLSKIWPRKEDWNTPSGGALKEVDRFRKELGTDSIDAVLIHCMTDAGWAEQYERIRDELSDLKSRGTVKAVGVSCHDFGALKVASEHPWVDLIFARINNKGGSEYSCDASADEVAAVLKAARKNGKAVVGMKIFGAGKLVKPEEKMASLRYVCDNQLVDAITVGMLNPSQVDDTFDCMSRV
jgi:aryl-alcohol dehydrogenase-like predicted oxidoreductase